MNKDYSSIIRNAQKADLHHHLTLGVHPKTLHKHFPDAKLNFPKRYFGLPGMIRFIHKNINKIMCDSEKTIQFMELAIEDCISDNVILLEASVDIKLKRYFSNSTDKLNEVVNTIKNKYKNQIEFRPDIGINKDIDFNSFESIIYDCINSGIYNGIDLYGIEKNRPLGHFRKVFADAHRKGIKTKVHIGEFSNKHTIEEAIILLDPDVIQHGIRAVQSEKTLELIKQRNITLNICPQSNVSLMSVRSIKHHPIKKIVEYGINVTINTDDLLLFNLTISDQYISLINSGVLTYEQIEEIRLNSLKESRLTTAST